MPEIVFLLNGEAQQISSQPATRTLLDWLRETKSLTGTKEGCNEGDCGACTVMVTDAHGAKAMNACILLMPQLHGKAVRTVEGMQGPDGQTHPVQDAMVKHHGSQCGFCTPGIVVSLATAHLNGAKNHDQQLAGNLCRCTGYAPIIRAAEAVQGADVPDWMTEDLSALKAIAGLAPPFVPSSVDNLADWYLENPDATLIAGATDVGLWLTKRLMDLPKVAFLGGIEALKQISVSDAEIRVGAGVTITDLEILMQDHYPSFSAMLRRYSSTQIRNAATIGGNIANGSPIGDGPPALIALGAVLHWGQCCICAVAINCAVSCLRISLLNTANRIARSANLSRPSASRAKPMICAVISCLNALIRIFRPFVAVLILRLRQAR